MDFGSGGSAALSLEDAAKLLIKNHPEAEVVHYVYVRKDDVLPTLLTWPRYWRNYTSLPGQSAQVAAWSHSREEAVAEFKRQLRSKSLEAEQAYAQVQSQVVKRFERDCPAEAMSGALT